MTISQSELLRRANKLEKSDRTLRSLTERLHKMGAAPAISAFLCHSHKDEELVWGLIEWFRDLNIELYVDWQDHGMPPTPNQETAKQLQQKILNAKIFLFLATENAKKSRWCPWEIGYANASQKSIWIIPTNDGNTTYGNEYLELYPRLDKGQKGLGYFQPNTTSGYLFEKAADLVY